MRITDKPIVPVECSCELLAEPIAPCELFADGLPGGIRINDLVYQVAIIGYLPPAPRGAVVQGYRFVRPDGECYDVRAVGGVLECECRDFEYRRRGRDDRGCKHCIAVRELLQAPREEYRTVGVVTVPELSDLEDL